MILITKNTSNKVVLTLSEKTTITDAVYLFEVTNDTTNDVKCFLASDISSFKMRYNQFLINENVVENLENGTVSLSNTGFYKYNVYEQSSTKNLDPLLATNLIESGKLKVIDTEITNATYSGNQTNYIVYGN